MGSSIRNHAKENQSSSFQMSFDPMIGNKSSTYSKDEKYVIFVFCIILIVPLFAIIGKFKIYLSYSSIWLVLGYLLSYILMITFFCITRFTEPGAIKKEMTMEDPPITLTDKQRKVSYLMTCVRNDNIDLLVKLLTHEPELINEQNIEGRTILHSCILYQKQNVLSAILLFNPNLFLKDRFHLASFHYASFMKNPVYFDILGKHIGLSQRNLRIEKIRCMNEALTILPIYDMKNDTYFGNTQFGREIVTDIQECIYTGPTVVTDRLKSLYISTSNESDCDDDDGVFETTSTSRFSTPNLYRNDNEKTETSSFKPIGLGSQRSRVKLPTYICVYEDSIITLKRCKTCHIFMPPRSFHCTSCDCCIRCFDHHCHWLGNCIGLRNHFYFYLFLFFCVTTILLGLYLSAWYIVDVIIRSYDRYYSFNTQFILLRCILILFFIITSVFLFSPMCKLFLYHSHLISENLTTHEDISLPANKVQRKEARQIAFAYSKGFLKNWLFSIKAIKSKSNICN